jgi:MFS family permease
VSLFRHKPFLLFFLGRLFSTSAYQIGAVAVGWQVYALTHSAFDLGMIGLVTFVPLAGLTFFAGHAADRYDRRRVVQVCFAVDAVTAAFLAAGTLGGWLSVPDIFCAAVAFGAARAFESPARAALLPAVLPAGLLQQGTAVSSSAFQLATIVAPAVGGILYGVSPATPYLLMTLCWGGGAILNGLIVLDRPAEVKAPPSFRALFAGIGFVRDNPAILGTISLDLFAVLLGGASALFPVYAASILHTGPFGLGEMRAALAVGALAMSVLVAKRPFTRRVGMRMFQAVIVFGVATLVFALSRSLAVSLVALVVMGAADMMSVVIRLSLVQLATPDDMRGRVGAVNFLFINASNELGEFESGVTAALLGAVPAVFLGGVGTICVALLWMRLFPALREMERLE